MWSGPVGRGEVSASWRDWGLRDIGLRVLVARRQYLERWDLRGLAAPHWRLYINGEAGAWVSLGGRRRELRPGVVWLVPPELDFDSGAVRPFTHFYVHFLIRPVWVGPGDLLEVGMEEGLEEDWRRLERSEGVWESSCWVERLVLGALGRLSEGGWMPEERDARAREIIRLMTGDPARGWTNVELARQAGMHPHAFARWFKERTGQTPHAFLLERRVQEACLLLHHTGKSIEEIAEATGFCDRYHLTRVFRARRGVGPARFRKLRAEPGGERRVHDAAV